MTQEAVCISGLRVRYAPGEDPALSIDALSVAAGERLAVIGPSGSGKTTLLRAVQGLVAPSEGTVTVDGIPTVSRAARRRAFRRRHAAVFQEFQLVERASVLRNVLCGRLGHAPVLSSVLGRFGAGDRAAAFAAIEATGLLEFAHRRVDTLSGGQRQRVAVARALAQAPDLITADEPVSNLDPVVADDILRAVMEPAGRPENRRPGGRPPPGAGDRARGPGDRPRGGPHRLRQRRRRAARRPRAAPGLRPQPAAADRPGHRRPRARR